MLEILFIERFQFINKIISFIDKLISSEIKLDIYK